MIPSFLVVANCVRVLLHKTIVFHVKIFFISKGEWLNNFFFSASFENFQIEEIWILLLSRLSLALAIEFWTEFFIIRNIICLDYEGTLKKSVMIFAFYFTIFYANFYYLNLELSLFSLKNSKNYWHLFSIYLSKHANNELCLFVCSKLLHYLTENKFW